ncbi:hypothetical protein MAR_004941 [Mya arenaria]|uniref:Uncharacterized protein n=1 Tax=Mya arenaria TaxID=6604 RepID=A0ABY7F190_MYAAR|nr:hypothetical protein MAR_004941 [Mya arenaria]
MSSIKQDMSQNSHSISNITDAIRTHIRRESLTSFGRRSFASGADLQLKNAHFESVSAAVVHLFQGKPLGENDLAALQESVREVLKTDAGPLVFDFYKTQDLTIRQITLLEFRNTVLLKVPFKVTTCESDSDDDISDRSDVTPGSKGHKHLSPLLSGVSHRPLGKRTSGLLPNPLLASVKEQDRGTIRRYSIATS